MASPNQRPGLAQEPNEIVQMLFSHGPSSVLTAAVKLGVFSHIAAGHRTAADAARAAGASERGTRMLLDALTGFGLLTKSERGYELSPLASRCLVKDSPDYMGPILEGELAESWGQLAEVIRTGRPVRQVEQQGTAEEFFPVLVQALHAANYPPAQRAAAALGAGVAQRGLRVLDVACGSGVWGIAVAEADPEARITCQDFPGMLEHTRKYLRRHGVESRCEFLPGDLKSVEFPAARFDLALLGNIVHSEGEASSRSLLRRLRRAIAPGGRVAIIDMVPNENRSGPPFPVLFALNMLLFTAEGDTYTLPEYTAWLKEAGFEQVRTADIGMHSPMIVAQ